MRQEGSIIPFTVEELNRHFENGTTMAHSILGGIVLFETNGFMEPYLRRELMTPSKKWMKEWFLHWPETPFGIGGSGGREEFSREVLRGGMQLFYFG